MADMTLTYSASAITNQFAWRVSGTNPKACNHSPLMLLAQ